MSGRAESGLADHGIESPHSTLTRRRLGRGSRRVASVVLAAAVCSAGCSRRHDIPVSNLPPELTVPTGATDVVARGDGKVCLVPDVVFALVFEKVK